MAGRRREGKVDVLQVAAKPGTRRNRDAGTRKRSRRALAAAGLTLAVPAVAVFAFSLHPEPAQASFPGIPCR